MILEGSKDRSTGSLGQEHLGSLRSAGTRGFGPECLEVLSQFLGFNDLNNPCIHNYASYQYHMILANNNNKY